MFSHVMIGTNDLEKAKAFYDALLGTLDVRPAKVDRHRIFYFTKTGTFSVSKPINGQPATPANGGTIGFLANSPGAGRRMARGRYRQWRDLLRRSAGHSRRGCGEALSGLFARSRRQQDLRDAPDACVSLDCRAGWATP